MTKPQENEICLHLTLHRLDDGSPANRLHGGPEKAYYCHDCGGTFFPVLTPATITVSYGKPESVVAETDPVINAIDRGCVIDNEPKP